MTDKKLTGSAGEYLVCGMLAQFKWVSSLTRDGVARTDVLAAHSESADTITIQVKTTWSRVASVAANWILGNVKLGTNSSEWFVLVKLEGAAPARARFFVVPRDHVAAATWIAYHAWRTEPGISAGTRNTPIALARVKEWVFSGYENQWELLTKPTVDVPVLLPQSHRELALEPRIGLPPGHSWLTNLPNW